LSTKVHPTQYTHQIFIVKILLKKKIPVSGSFSSTPDLEIWNCFGSDLCFTWNFYSTAKTYQESEAAGPASEAKKIPNFRW